MDSAESYSSLCWAVTRMAAYVEGALEACDLTSRQYRMLVAIAQGPVSASALAERIGVAPPSVTAMVRGLIHRGAVRRETASDDQRRVWLSVTDDGRRLLDRAEAATRGCLWQIAEGFEDDGQARGALQTLEVWNPPLDRYRLSWLQARPPRPAVG